MFSNLSPPLILLDEPVVGNEIKGFELCVCCNVQEF